MPNWDAAAAGPNPLSFDLRVLLIHGLPNSLFFQWRAVLNPATKEAGHFQVKELFPPPTEWQFRTGLIFKAVDLLLWFLGSRERYISTVVFW